MTTSHRPQLEARSGAKAASYVPTSTQHARLLPGYRKLKYRKSKNEQELVKNKDGDENEECDMGDEKNDVDDGDGDDADDDTDDVDGDDQEALLLELNNIRKERMTKRIRDEQNSQSKRHDRGWRMTTFGRNRISKQKRDDPSTPDYINDITKTEYHEDFIRRFIK